VSWPKSAADEKVGSLWAPVGTSVSSGLRGFNISLEGHPVEGLGACPLLWTLSWVGGPLRVRPRVYLEALCIEARRLTDKQ
jgi:hypothetical protein